MKQHKQTSPYEQEGREPVEGLSLSFQSPHNTKERTFKNPTFQQLYTNKLLRREELQIEDNILQTLLEEGYFHRIDAIQADKSYYSCVRCNNRARHLFGEIPCKRCCEPHLYCRQCIMMGRIMQCDYLYEWKAEPFAWPKVKDGLQWKGQLSTAQQSASNEIIQAIKKKEARLLWAVTGAGKTEILFHGINESLRDGERICIATPRVDVVKELIPRFKAAFPSVSIEALHSESEQKLGVAQLIITTTHQLLRFKHAFDVMIIDEVDAFPYYMDDQLQFAVKRAAKPDGSMIYLTATPRKSFLRRMKKEGVAVIFLPIRHHQHPLIMPQTMYVYQLEKKLHENKKIKQLEKWLLRRDEKQGQLLIFMPTIRTLIAYKRVMSQLLIGLGMIGNEQEIETVHANDLDRTEKIESFRRKKTKVLMTTTILERGVTFPSIDVIVLNASNQVFDMAALVQIAGRAGRDKDNPRGDVLFLHEGLTEAILEAKEMIRMMNKKRMQMKKRHS